MNDYLGIMNRMAMAVAKASIMITSDFCARFNQSANELIEKTSVSSLPDFATKTDIQSETMIRDAMALTDPGLAFMGEELGGNYDHEKFILVDGLDGTSNFVGLRDYFGICAAYIEGGEVRAAVIADPCRRLLVKAAYGQGAFLQTDKNERKLARLSFIPDDQLKTMQLECEMSIGGSANLVKTQTHGAVNPFQFITPLMQNMSGFRKSGSTAIDLIRMAQGQRSIVLSSGLKPYDIAAGVLIVEETGGIITDLRGKKARYTTDAILAAAPGVHAKALAFLPSPK